MARSTKRINIDVNGLSLQDINNISWADLSKLSDRSLGQVATRMMSAVNKRIKRLRTSELNSPALRALDDAGINKFSVKGQSYEQLKTTISQMKSFMNYETGSVRGAKKVKKEMKERVKEEFDIDEQAYQSFDWNQFWDVYNKLKQTNQALFSQLKSKELQEAIYNQMTVSNPSHHTTAWRLKKLSQTLYDKQKTFEDKRQAEIDRIKKVKDKFIDVY